MARRGLFLAVLVLVSSSCGLTPIVPNPARDGWIRYASGPNNPDLPAGAAQAIEIELVIKEEGVVESLRPPTPFLTQGEPAEFDLLITIRATVDFESLSLCRELEPVVPVKRVPYRVNSVQYLYRESPPEVWRSETRVGEDEPDYVGSYHEEWSLRSKERLPGDAGELCRIGVRVRFRSKHRPWVFSETRLGIHFAESSESVRLFEDRRE